MLAIKWEITSVNQRLVKVQGAAGQQPTQFVIWEVTAVATPDNLPLDQQQVVNGQLNMRWSTLPPFAAGDVVTTPWPAKA